MNRINFSHNWNRKLDCNVFSTIRLHNPAVYSPGKTFEVYETTTKPARFRGRVEVVEVWPFYLHQLKPAMAMLDTGYSLPETINIIKTMYIKDHPDIDKTEFAYILLKKIKVETNQQKLFEK